MNLKQLYEMSHKLNGGPAGIRCPCCNNFGTVKHAKQRSNQIVRRNAKMNLKKMVDI